METRCYNCNSSFFSQNHNFNTDEKFILIKPIHIDIDKEKNKERLKQKRIISKLMLRHLQEKFLN